MAGLFGGIGDWIIGGISGIVALIGGYLRRVDRRSEDALEKAEKNERALYGVDEDNPFDEGIIEIVREIREEHRHFREEMQAEHREVMRRLDELDGD